MFRTSAKEKTQHKQKTFADRYLNIAHLNRSPFVIQNKFTHITKDRITMADTLRVPLEIEQFLRFTCYEYPTLMSIHTVCNDILISGFDILVNKSLKNNFPKHVHFLEINLSPQSCSLSVLIK